MSLLTLALVVPFDAASGIDLFAFGKAIPSFFLSLALAAAAAFADFASAFSPLYATSTVGAF